MSLDIHLEPNRDFRRVWRARGRVALGVIAAIHLAALGIMAWTEYGWFGRHCCHLLAWASLNFIFLALLRRPGVAAALSLVWSRLVVVLSQFKFSILWMVINFFDVLIIDSDTIGLLLSIFPDLRTIVIIAALLAVPVLVLIWRIDPFRVPRAISLLGAPAAALPSPACRWQCRKSPGSSSRASITSRRSCAPA